MSLHYLIDPFTTNGDIIDVATAITGTTPATGSTLIRVPDGVAIHDNPADLPTLLTKKYDGLLASYAGFPEILADACLDQLTWNLSLCSKFLASGGFVNHCILNGGSCITTAVALPFAPTQCVLVWEEYTFTDSDDSNERYLRTYVEASGSNFISSVTFGAGSLAAINGGVLNIPVPDQGTAFKVAFSNPTANRVYLGSWALVY